MYSVVLAPQDHYRLQVIGVERGAMACSNGLSVTAHRHFSEALGTYDLLLVAGGPQLPFMDFGSAFDSWLRDACARARRFGSICRCICWRVIMAPVFAGEAKVTPAEFVERARVDAARVMLESTAAPLKTVSYQCGFRDAQHMCSVFNRRLGVTPQQFRMNFAVML